MRTWTGICASALLALVVAGCESKEDECNAAMAELRAGLRDAVGEATAVSREATGERQAAMQTLARVVMDLGNLRSEEAVAAIGTDGDGAVGIEVSIGALMAALLAVEGLADTDQQAAERMGDAVQTELEGRYRELMTWDVTRDGAGAHLAETGDRCSTGLQNLVRELPTEIRSAVLARFVALSDDEGEPDEATNYGQVTTAFTRYQELRATAAAARVRSEAIVAALDALDGSVQEARASFDALPADIEVSGARSAAPRAWEACVGAEH